MKKYILIVLSVLVLACQEDDALVNNNSVSFAQQTVELVNNSVALNIVFMNPAAADGFLTLSVTPTNVEYGTDFITDPAVVEEEIIIPFAANATSVPFNFTALNGAIEGQQKSVVLKIMSLTISSVAIPAATSTVQIDFDESPVSNNTIAVATGGANVPNQVYVDLSSGIQTSVLRTRWDLGFYSGDEFRVALNGSINMAVKQLVTTDMMEVIAIDESVAVGVNNGGVIFNGNILFTDSPTGDINQTAITVFENDADNKVYLLNLGFGIATDPADVGTVNAYGESRDWMKIRVLRDGDGYKLQYAAPDALTFTEVAIPKSADHNFTFYSFDTDALVTAEPQKTKWDLNFTTFTDHVNIGGMFSLGVADFVVTNVKGGTRAYEVLVSSGVAYEDFTLANVSAAAFNTATAADQRAIGSNWRTDNGTSAIVNTDRFYIVRDAASNIFKLRFTALVNNAGIRGNTTFEYEILQ